ATAAMADRIFDDDFARAAAVVELDRDGIGDRALRRIEIVPGKLLILDAYHLVPQRVDPRVGGNAVFVIPRQQTAVDERHGGHVLDAMVAIGWICERTLLVDDADGRFVCANRDLRDVVDAILHQR